MGGSCSSTLSSLELLAHAPAVQKCYQLPLAVSDVALLLSDALPALRELKVDVVLEPVAEAAEAEAAGAAEAAAAMSSRGEQLRVQLLRHGVLVHAGHVDVLRGDTARRAFVGSGYAVLWCALWLVPAGRSAGCGWSWWSWTLMRCACGKKPFSEEGEEERNGGGGSV